MIAAAVVAHGAWGTGSSGQKPAVDSEALVLFDGKSLDGWKAVDFHGAGEVKVDDGAIVMDAGTPMTGITTTRSGLPRVDFELTYEAKRLRGNDFFAAATFPVGKSYITLVNGGWGGNVTGLSSLNGADASENGTSKSVKYENGKWYRFRVWVTDQTIRCWVDDKQIIDVDYRDREVRTRIEVRRNQPLGFATYDCAGAVRKIQLRRLTADEITSVRKIAEEE